MVQPCDYCGYDPHATEVCDERLTAQRDAAMALLRRYRASASKSWGEAEKLDREIDAFLADHDKEGK